MNQCGKLKELTYTLDKDRWDIIGLSQTHVKKCGEFTTEEGHGFWFSGDDEKQQHGVGFIANRTRIKSVISCIPVSSRIITIRISAKPKNITLIQAYAPTSTYDDDLVEEFYEQLESTINSKERPPHRTRRLECQGRK